MATTVVQQPQQQPTTAPTAAKGPTAPGAPNDQAAAAAKTERRKRSAALVPPAWQAALSTLLPADPNAPLGNPPVADVRRAAFRLDVRDVRGFFEALTYLQDAEAPDPYLAAMRELDKNAQADKGTFGELRSTIATLTAGGDLNTASLSILATLAKSSDDAKTYLQQDDAPSADPITRPLRAYIDDSKHWGDPNDAGVKAQKAAWEGLVTAIHHPHNAAAGVPPPVTPAPLTPIQQKASDALIADVQQRYPLVDAAKVDPKAAIKPEDLAALLAKINAAEAPVREHVYAWRDPKSGKGVLQLFGSHLSPSQVEEVNAALDPVERLYKECSDIRNGRSQTKQPGAEYQTIHDFLAAHLGDEPTRHRVRDHAPLMQQFVQWWPDPQRKLLLRMIVTGHEQPDAVDRIHDAADAGDSNAAITAIYDLGSTPDKLQDLRKDLIFVHRLQDRCGKRVVWNGIETTAYELFLRMCGVDPSNTREAGSVDKQTEVDPNAQAAKPLTPEERGALDAELYVPFIKPIVDQLNSWWTRDSKVMSALRDFQARCAKPDNVDKLRRAHEAPGPELAKRIQAAGCDVRLKLQRGLDADNLVEAERILAFVADQATVGVLGGQGTLVTDNRPASGQGKVPLEQALRETTLKSGTVLTQVIHDKAHELADEFGRWFGARAGHIRSIWQAYRAEVTDEVCADLREKTGMARVWPIELLANAFVQVGGGTLQSKLQSELGKDPVIAEMGMQPGDVDARRTLAEQKVVQDNKDESKNTAAMATAQAQVQQAAQLDQFKAPAKELFDALAGINRFAKDEELTALGGKLSADLKLGPIPAAPKNVTAGPVAAPIAEHDVSARPGGPAHPDAPAPTDFTSYYRQQYGIEPRRHAVEVAKAIANSERAPQAVGKLLGVDDPSLFAPPKAPSEQLAITPDNQTLVGPDFTVDEANKRARKMWDLLHDNGQIQLIRQQIDGRTAEEQRLIHIAFRQLSGGIDLAFYIQQHLSQQQQAVANGGDDSMAVSVGGGGTGDTDKRGVRVIGDQAETEMLLEVSTKGRVSLEKRIAGSIAADNMDDVYAAIEGASADERRAILANDALMNQLRKFGDDSYEWNRIYKGLSGESDMFDRLESRAHGAHGFLGAFEGTDEKGMSTDIKSYAKQRAKAIRAQVTKEICGDAQPTQQQKKMIEDRVAQQLSAEFQANSENPEIRAILHDELSGVELSQREGQMMNAGDDSKVASALTEGDWTEDEEKIIDDIKHMSPDERRRCRNNPEYINQLHKAIQSQTTWRDAMIALDSDADGSKDDDEDNFAKLERASRSSRQDTTELMFEQDDVIQALSRLSPEDYARLQADPRLQAQILTSLEGYPDKLKMARQMMAFNAADAGAATGLQIGDKPDPAKGVYSRKQVERLAFLKFGAENRIRAGSDRSWAMLVQAAEAIYNMKLRPSEGDAEAAPDAAPHVPSAVAATAGSGDTSTLTVSASNTGAPQPDGAPTPQAAPKPAEAPPVDPKDGEGAIEDRLRHDILGDTQSIFVAATEGFGDEKGSDDKHERTSISPKRQQEIITKAILHEQDPSDNLLMASTAWYGDDEDRIKDTIHKASDDQLIKEWTTVIHKSPNGSDSLGDKYTTWKSARDAAGADAKAPEGKRNPKVGSPEWKARTAFKCHILDTSEVFEDLLLKYTGGLFADDDKMKKGEDRVRDNKEWLEWRTLVRDRIPALDKTKIGGAIHANDDAEAMEIINDPTLRNTLNALSYDEERYAVDRGENSNYNMDRVTAGGQGLALDNAMGDYRREVLTSVISKGPDAGNQYGVITAEEGGRIADAKARFNTSDSEFRAAKAAVANIAATVVALVITAVVTILTAGTATGPVAVILLGAATAAASSAGTQLTKEAIQGTDFDLGKEGLENIARDTVMGAVTAGSTYYAGKIAGSLWNTTAAAEQAAIVGNIAKSQSFFQQMGKSATEMALMTGMEGVFESGMAAFDPALWMDGWSEGWRRGGAAARERAQGIPIEMLRAALLAAFSHAVTTGGGKLFGAGGEGEAEGELQHAAFNNRQTLAERVVTVAKAMKGGITDGLVTGAGELLFDERTFRGEGAKPMEIIGTLSKNVIDMMNMAATNIHMSDAGGVQRMRTGGRELALHGHELTPELQEAYAELITHGHDGSIITIAEFKKLHEAALARQAPSASEAPASTVMPEPKVATVDPTTSKATQVEISKVEGEEKAKLGELTPVEQNQLEDMLRAHGTEHGRELFEAWRAKQPAADVSATPDPVKTADAAFARGDLDAAHEALQKLDPDTRAKVEQSLLTKYGANLAGKESARPIGDEAGDTEHRVAANGPHVTERVKSAMDRMDPASRAQLDATMSRAQNDGQRVLMERAVAAGHSPDEVHQLFLAMHGLSEAEALTEFSGVGVVQLYQASCVPTSYQIALAEVDPVFALKLRNNPEMVLGQQREALEAAGGARHQRADVRKGQDVPEAMQDHLDDPRARKALEDPSNYGPGTGGGIEATKMVDQSLHKQLEATTGVKYDVITNDSLSYDTPGQGEFGHHQVPHDRIVAALDAGLPVLIGMMGHANVIVGHSTGSDGKEMYILSDPMSGKTSKLPADLLDVVMVQSLTIPHVEPKPAVTPEIGANKPVVENKATPAPRGDEMADDPTRTGGTPDPVADPKLVELATKAREKYGPALDEAIVTLDAMVGDLGHVEGRAKDPVSAANRLQRAIDKFGAKVTDVDSAIANLWDAIGTRIVVDHPTPDVMAKVVARLVDAINAGKLKVSMANNLHGEGGLPYMTPEQMQQIAEAAGRANGKEIEVDEAKKMPGGFTSATIYVEYPGGVKGEIQIIGKGAMAVAEVEHIPYDVGLGKPLVRNIDPKLEPELRGVVAPIETAIREVNADPARKAAYDQYLCDMYRHVRALEMGQESTPPTVPAGIDPALSYESLVKVQDAVAAIKAKSKGGSSTPEVAKPETADALDVKTTDGGSLTGGGEGERKPAAIRTPVTPSEAEDAKQLEKSTNRLATTFGDRLEGADTKLVGPPTDRPVIQQSASDALIGLPTDSIPPGMSAEQAIKKLQSDGMPRWGALTANERAHETAFASVVEQNLPAMVEQFFGMSRDKAGTYIFEVDGAKKLYGEYGADKAPANTDELHVRATANHALHPTAVAIARIAFLRALDEMAALPATDPRKAVFVTNGGCAAGKGSLTEIVKGSSGGKFNFGAVWDAAGEGDSQENGWILAAAQSRGIKVTYGFVESDPMVTYNGVLDRAQSTGRIVDPITFTRSYTRGQENMREFLASPEYQAALAKGEVDAVGVYTGKFDMATKTFPQKHMLGDEGRIGAKDIKDAPDEAAVTAKAIEIFQQWLARQEAEGKPTDDWFEGGAVNTLKFGQSAEAPQTAASPTQTGGSTKLTADELQKLLRRADGEELKDKALRPDISGPLATDEGNKLGASLPPAPEGQYRTIDGSLASTGEVSLSPEARQYLAEREAKRGELTGSPRKVVVDGGGPTGALTAIQAYNLGHDVTIVEMRDNATLPILWSNRPGNMDVLQLIDPVLADRVRAASGAIHFYEHVDQDGSRSGATPDANRVTSGEHATGDARAIAGETSSWQSQNKTEVNLMWDRLEELAKTEADKAKAEGREPRLKLLRGYEVKALPEGEGDKRGIVVQKVEDRLQKLGADGRPAKGDDGKPLPTEPYTPGSKVPDGYKKVRGTDGNDVDLGTPDDIFVAEGAGSKTRAMAGSKSVDVGPSAQYIAGYFDGAPLKSSPDAEGQQMQGGSRSIVDTARDGSAIHAVAGTGEHLGGTWALPEVDPTLDLNDPKSIEKYFGRPMSTKDATLTYYKQQIGKVLEVPPETIPDNGFVFGPAAFTLQSHVSTPVSSDAQNVHLIGDARGNSHFLASLGKVTGTGTHQMAVRQYFEALQWGLDPEIASAILERRLDAGTRVWLKSGLPSFTDRTPAANGAADGTSVLGAAADSLAAKDQPKLPTDTVVKAVAGPSGSTPADKGPITVDHFPQAQLVIEHNNPQVDANGYRAFMADSANQALADLEAGRPMAEVMAGIEARRVARGQDDAARDKAKLDPTLDATTRAQKEAQIDAKVAKMQTPIVDGDPNYDPFGQLSGRPADTPGTRTRADIGGVMSDRFTGTDGDTVVNKVTVDIDGQPTVLDGNTLHRRASAETIDDTKGNKYGYDPAKDQGKLVISETADPKNQQIFKDAGLTKLDRMTTVTDFADAAYLLFMGPVVNRGSDSNIRTLLTAAYTRKFGTPVALPQDIDVQAYARDQGGFKSWLVDQLNVDGPKGSGTRVASGDKKRADKP